MYVRGYLQGSENGRVVTIEGLQAIFPEIIDVYSRPMAALTNFT